MKSGEYFFYINYFGLKRSFIEQLRENYGNRLLIDNTHDFFARDSRVYYSFNSARKFFGVSDGAFLYGPKCEVDIKQLTRFNKSDNTPNTLRLNKDYENAFTAYQKYEESLGCEVNRISTNSERILKGIDYVKIRKTRRANFKFLHAKLKEKNIFKLESLGCQDPFCYPFLPINNINIIAFHQERLFIPRLWQDIIYRKLKVSKFERSLCEDLLPIPIDHRYSEDQLGRIVRLVNKLS